MKKRNKKISVPLVSGESLNYKFKKKGIIRRIAIINNIDLSAVAIVTSIVVGTETIVPAHKENIINNIKDASYFPYDIFVRVNKNETITASFNTPVTVVINFEEDE